MYRQFDIGAKDIEGYKLVKAPIVPYTAVAGISLLGIVTALFKRKKEDK